ncbi:hypothetical protein QNI23_014320 [Bermanella sp. WJH001]|uniref:hypothetical protein n=1 Tax=Bermanella sp. WJH001 TaxID=3048005 RepID=UPI0024BD789A|nr:hypothetical protein [Bermanella sp. WJH001]MDJ1538167.1 hypothetical protein [Bermanella sp. WJH001]
MSKKEEIKIGYTIKQWAVFIISILLLVSVIALINYSGVTNDLGTTGDAVGGLLNPILTFITVVLLINTLKQNQAMLDQNQEILISTNKQLELSEEEMGKTREIFERELENSSLQLNDDFIKLISAKADNLIQDRIFKIKARATSAFEILHFSKNENLSEKEKIEILHQLSKGLKTAKFFLEFTLLLDAYISIAEESIQLNPKLKAIYGHHDIFYLNSVLLDIYSLDKEANKEYKAILREHNEKIRSVFPINSLAV